MPSRLLLVLASFALGPAAASEPVRDLAYVEARGELIFRDGFDRDEKGNLAAAIGEGWNSATADRVPDKKQADLDDGILKVDSAPEANHAAHIHHEAGFGDGAALVRFRLPGLRPGEDLTFGFVDRECRTSHAGHLCYAMVRSASPTVTLIDRKTGTMDLENRRRAEESRKATGKLPPDLEALYREKERVLTWQPDTEWHDLLLVVEGDRLFATLDDRPLGELRSEGVAHPTKRWVSLLVGATAWIDEVKVWRFPAEADAPFDPAKICRLSLDGLPRSLALAAGDSGIWLGYDLERARLFRVWRAAPGRHGLTVSGFTTKPAGEMLFSGPSDGASPPWQWRRAAAVVVPKVRYLGCRDGGDFFELSWELSDGKDRLTLRERVPASGETASRELRAEGLADGESLPLPDDLAEAWSPSSAAAPRRELNGDAWHRFEWSP